MLIINSTYHPPLKYTMSFMSIISLHIEAMKLTGLCHHHLNLSQSKERNNTRWTTYEIVNFLVAHSNSSFAGKVTVKGRTPGSLPHTYSMHRKKSLNFTFKIQVHLVRCWLSFTCPYLGSFTLISLRSTRTLTL